MIINKVKRKPERSDYSIHSKDDGTHQVESTEQKKTCVRGLILFKSPSKQACTDWINKVLKVG